MTVALPVLVRAASFEDIDALADLLVQLYHAEMPGTLHGPLDGQRALMRYMLERGGYGSWHGRYVAVDEAGSVVATATIRLPTTLPGTPMPSGVTRKAVELLGVANTLRMFGAFARATFSVDTRQPLNTAFVHSVVVDAQRRGAGTGSALMRAVEEQARVRGMRAVQLRVIVGNQGARRVYERLGYRQISRTPRLLDSISFPTELFEKSLA